MAKGQGLLKGLFNSKLVKGVKTKLKSNLKVDGQDLLKGTARRGQKNARDTMEELSRNTDSVGKNNIIDNFSKSGVDEANLKNIGSNLGDDSWVKNHTADDALDEMMKTDGYDNINVDDFKKSYGEHKNFVESEDYAQRVKDRDEYRSNFKENDAEYDKIINDDYYGDHIKEQKNLRDKEYNQKNKEYKESGVEYDKEALKKELDEKYKVDDDPYEKINEEMKTEREAMEKFNNESRKNTIGTDGLSTEQVVQQNKANDTFYESMQKNFDKKYNHKKEGIFKESGYREGTRSGALSELMGTGPATASKASEYFYHGASKEQALWRGGAAVAGVGATMVGARYLSGGNMSYNADGEKDVAGIPFI